MNSNPLRLTTLLISTALLLAALAAAAPGAPAAAKKCPQGKVAWKLEGRSACLASPVGAAKGKPGPAIAELWLREASRPGPGGKQQLSPALRSALPRAGALLAKKIAGVGGGAGISSAARGPVIEQGVLEVGKEDLGNGVVAEGRIRAKIYEDYSEDLEIEFEMRDRNGNSVLYQPDYSSLFAGDEEVGCPTAAGLVEIQTKGQIGGTVIHRKGKRVVGSKTVSKSWRVRARGQVGTDARLHSVAADVSFTTKQFERGLQYEMTFTTAASLPRQGAAKVTGTPQANVSVKVAGASRAAEREYELAAARELAGTPELAQSVAGIAGQSRDQLVKAEPTWYALPNECAQIAWDPGAGITLEPDQTRRLTGTVIATRGGQASGRIDLTSVDRGRLIPVTPGFTPTAPASFIAAGAEPDAREVSVQASAIATSTAGRAQATWSARATAVKLPERFVGTIASTKSSAGLTRSFHGNATYTRTSVVRGPDGSLNAWYELTAATLGGAKEILGAPTGCRYEANGTNGQIESGDLELRVLPGGEVVYALSYDLAVPSQFIPTDCPPDSPNVPFDGDISVFLNSHKPGPVEGQMRPVGAGFQIQENGVGDVTDLPGLTTTASWTIVPG